MSSSSAYETATTGGGGFGSTTVAAAVRANSHASDDGDGSGMISRASPENPDASIGETEESSSGLQQPNQQPEHQPQQPTHPTVFKPPNELAWDARVEELLEYKRVHGDTDVPNTFDENPSLARWVGDQRRAYKRSNMAKHRVDRLEEIGFLWSKAIKSPWEVKWDARFAELEKFMYKYGQIGTTLNGNVHPQWHTLSEWATHQRKRYKEGKLRKDLAEKLGAFHIGSVVIRVPYCMILLRIAISLRYALVLLFVGWAAQNRSTFCGTRSGTCGRSTTLCW
jgi:Helicase associated domain